MVEVDVYCDQRRKSAKGYPVKLVVKTARGRVMVSTGIYCEEEWTGTFAKNEPSRRRKESALQSIRAMAADVLEGYDEKSLEMSAVKALVESAMKGKSTNLYSEFAMRYAETANTDGTRKCYMVNAEIIGKYDPTATLDSITPAWLERFEVYARSENPRTGKKSWRPNYYGRLEREIRTVLKWAKRQGYTANDPFENFKCKEEKTRKRNLKLEEVRQLRDWECEEYQRKYRDVFMLQIYLQGIDIVDLLLMPHPKRGRNYLDFERTKSKGMVHVKIEPEAWEIIRRYEGKELLLRFAEERRNYKDFLQRMNEGLKKIGELKRVGLGGRKIIEPLFPDLTSKWARHTWATLAGRLPGVAKSEIGTALGHMDAMTVDIYMENDLEKNELINRRVIDMINCTGESKEGHVDRAYQVKGGEYEINYTMVIHE